MRRIKRRVQKKQLSRLTSQYLKAIRKGQNNGAARNYLHGLLMERLYGRALDIIGATAPTAAFIAPSPKKVARELAENSVRLSKRFRRCGAKP